MARKLLAGIDLGGTAIKYGLVTRFGEVLHRDSLPTGKTRRGVISQFAAIATELETVARSLGGSFTTLGIGSPGHVDIEQGKVVSGSPNVRQWRGTDIRGDLMRLLANKNKLQIFTDNDANAMALAEHLFGAGRGFNSGLYLTVGTGLGSGIILDNRIWRGSHYAGAELGHSIIVKDGYPCQCGKHGCLEMYVNAASFVRYFGAGAPKAADARWVFDRAGRGDKRAVAAIEQSAQYLACGIGSALELLDTEIVVIGGGVSHGGRLYLNAVKRELKTYASLATYRRVKVALAQLGNDAGLLGAALLPVADKLLL